MINLNTNEINKWLKKINYEPNILEYYDNVTYNIRFYMINHLYQNKLSQDRAKGIIPNNYRLPDSSKIIIAETGVSTNYDITSLILKTVHSSVSNSSSATTYQMDMKIKEINGCSLINKITAVSKLVGYESYILQPFHVDIWFSGFEQSSGKPIKIIGDIVLTYEVLISEVKTNVDVSGTMYNFIMSPVPQSSFNKNINSLFNMGMIESKSGTMKGFKEEIERLMNDKFFKENPALISMFPNRDFIKIDNLLNGDTTSYAHKLIEEHNKQNPDIIVPKYPYTPIDENERKTRTQTEITYQQNPKKISGGLNIEDVKVDIKSSPQNTDDNNVGMIRPDNNSSFDEIFQILCFNTIELRNYTARPVYKTEYLGNINGQEVQRIHIDIVFNKNNYLETFMMNYKENNQNKEQNIQNMQLKELQNLYSKNTLRKKYEWLFNGHDTSIIEMNSSIDKLWYSNIPINDVLEINQNSFNNDAKTDNTNIAIKYAETIRQETLYKEKLNYVINFTNKPLDGIRNLTADGRLYLDDIYYCIEDNTKEKYLSGRNVLEKPDPFSKSNPLTDTSNIQFDSQVAKVGYNNIHQAGNLVELKIKILGDPFWLGVSSDNSLYEPNNSIGYSDFQHFSFKMNTALDQKLDGTYDLESVTDFSSIYQIVESVSYFEEGKFIQELTGVLNQAFINTARLKV